MKIFGIHNTTSVKNKIRHQVPKLHMDRSNGVINLNAKLLSLLEINRKDIAFVLFIQLDDGRIGLCKTKDSTIGIPIHWYKSDKRGRLFNSTMVDIIRDKHNIEKSDASLHASFGDDPEVIKNYTVFIIKDVELYHRPLNTIE